MSDQAGFWGSMVGLAFVLVFALAWCSRWGDCDNRHGTLVDRSDGLGWVCVEASP